MFVLLALASVVSVPVACVAHSRASSQVIPDAVDLAVVVLGYPTRWNGKPHPLQIWRSQIAAKTVADHEVSTVVFTGRGRRGEPSEALVMAGLAGLNGPTTILENRSTNTWENVANASALVVDADVVLIVSDPLHAARARRYWLKQNPADADRVFVTNQSSFWDHWWLKVPTAIDAAAHALLHRVLPG